MRRYGHIDANQPEIVEALRKAGASVYSLASVGSGCPDLLVGLHDTTWLLEVKNPKGFGKRNNAAGTKTKQEAWAERWRGTPVITVTCPEEALRAVGLWL